RQRGSSPKIVVLNTALMTAVSGRSHREIEQDREYWGRLVETAVGAHLVNASWGTSAEILYWRQGNREVDYVVRDRGRVVGIEVTSGRRKGSLPGMAALAKEHPLDRRLLVGGQGVALEEFLSWGPNEI